MKEQVNRLSSLGLRATYTEKKDCCKDDVTRGYYQFLFENPKVLVGNDIWRRIFRHPEFSRRHKLTVMRRTQLINGSVYMN